MKCHWNHLLVILFVTGLVFFSNLGGPRLWDRDEPRNAGCAAEMLQRGDWVTPVFNGELRSHKPVLLYWLMMAAYTVFGVSEFAARFWSAVLGTGTVLLTYLMGRRLFHPRAGIWSAVILASTMMFGLASRAATPDSVLIFCSTAALALYVCGTFQQGALDPEKSLSGSGWEPARIKSGSCFPENRWIVLGMYAFMALGVLAKGPVALILPMAVIGMFMLIQRWASDASGIALADHHDRSLLARSLGRVRSCLQVFYPRHFLSTLWAMRPFTALAMLSLIALPWYVWVGIRTEGAWLQGFLLEHNFQRAMQPMEGHGGSIFYYPVAALIGFFPWSNFAIPMLLCAGRRVRRDQAGHATYVFVLCWVGVYISLFSVAQTKLPSYITPCYPALALLAGAFFFHWMRKSSRAASWWPYCSMGSMVLVGVAIIVGVSLVARRYLPGDEWICWFGMVLVLGGVAGALLIAVDRLRLAGWTIAGTSVVFVALIFGYVSQVIDSHQQADRLLTAIGRHHESPIVGVLGALEPSWVYYLGNTIQVLYAPRNSGPDQVAADRASRPWAAREEVPVMEFLQQGSDRIVITTDREFAAIRETLPADLVVLSEVRYFLKKERLLAIARQSTGKRQVARPPPADLRQQR